MLGIVAKALVTGCALPVTGQPPLIRASRRVVSRLPGKIHTAPFHLFELGGSTPAIRPPSVRIVVHPLEWDFNNQ